ncbi:RCC1/BLIP-II protein [Suhomyces tanzawaensis NRRL Y-17324]|uniref:RCC1/BLIP-II protein n=1 Tax=Suhomyces tanzawaensis NRRL Y-17324 TaxID=984487 RepID=A0A1E4SLD6_9ASCO|nr:RCC1/BLIP-II protein [Suhomyces tanzawaensis NRRL Y-17324]ODV80314.1 RCC1/BLIP-II protein [Suhomyces tanzawaensis NRRL Y-17324]
MYQVLCCGSNGQYQLGIGNDTDQLELVAAKFEIDGTVTTQLAAEPVEVVCGGNHTLVLFSTGEIYSCGDNTFGQCGHQGGQTIEVFRKIDGKWAKAACGWEFTILVDLEGKVYSCGRGLKGELGLGKGVDGNQLREVIDFGPQAVLSVRSSLNHTVVQLADKRLFGWGNARKGQLGVQNAIGTKLESVIWQPRQLKFEGLDDLQVRFFDVGRDYTAFYSNDYKEYGKKATEKVHVNGDVVGLRTMWSSSHLLVKNEKHLSIKSFGNDSHGQLFPQSAHPVVQQFEIGSEHGLILTDQNSVMAWGWGEHGNCGERSGDEVYEDDLSAAAVTYSLNTIYNQAHPVTRLGSGCATSWITIRKL